MSYKDKGNTFVYFQIVEDFSDLAFIQCLMTVRK
jgi:hypothetical protein